jgi:hypothetical protein
MSNTKSKREKMVLSVLNVTDKDYSVGEYDLPYVRCPYLPDDIPDYLALYSDKGEYSLTPKTCVCFEEWDDSFFGKNGLWAAIYYKDEKLLTFFKKRFEGVRLFIGPDISTVQGINRIENLHRYFAMRVISVWMSLELGALVIPFVGAPSKDYFPQMIEGMEDTEVVAFSLKGYMKSAFEMGKIKEEVGYCLEHLPKLKAIVVYSVSNDEDKNLGPFADAIAKGVKVFVPDNRGKVRNRFLGRKEDRQ